MGHNLLPATKTKHCEKVDKIEALGVAATNTPPPTHWKEDILNYGQILIINFSQFTRNGMSRQNIQEMWIRIL